MDNSYKNALDRLELICSCAEEIRKWSSDPNVRGRVDVVRDNVKVLREYLVEKKSLLEATAPPSIYLG